MTECNQGSFPFHVVAGREVVARFDGGRVTSDGGGLLLTQIDSQFGFIAGFAKCFADHRDPELIEHPLEDLLRQRVYGIALGYEDLNDHDQLRSDPLLAVMLGKSDPLGSDRRRERDRGKALAGKSTLNRLELTPVAADQDSRYKKIVAHQPQIEQFFVEAFLAQYIVAPDRIVLDFDATDAPIHGDQLGKFFHGYYQEYCYLPLYVFCGDHLLVARLRPSNIDACAGALSYLKMLVTRIGQRWPQTKIVVRGDSGFCRDELMSWCEANGVDYVLGLAKNQRLLREIDEDMRAAEEEFHRGGVAVRKFRELTYRTLKSWSRDRRVVAKAEHLEKGANPRFVVTSLSSSEYDASTVYEREYCSRGDMENRIKEQQLYLYAARVSVKTMRGNQLRLWFSAMAYVLMRALREFGLSATDLARARCDTIRLRLLKIGAVIRVTVRKVWVSMSEGYPWQALFSRVVSNLSQLGASPLGRVTLAWPGPAPGG